MSEIITAQPGNSRIDHAKLNELQARLDGDVFTDKVRLLMYSTDASC